MFWQFHTHISSLRLLDANKTYANHPQVAPPKNCLIIHMPNNSLLPAVVAAARVRLCLWPFANFLFPVSAAPYVFIKGSSKIKKKHLFALYTFVCVCVCVQAQVQSNIFFMNETHEGHQWKISIPLMRAIKNG